MTDLQMLNVTAPWTIHVENVPYFAVALITTCLILGSNGLNIAIITNNATLRNDGTSYYMVELAFADMSVGLLLALPATVASLLNGWPFGEAFCKFCGFIGTAAMGVSIWGIALISVDRYIYICKSLHYHSILTLKRRLFTMAIPVVFDIILFTIPIIMNSYGKTEEIQQTLSYSYDTQAFVCTFTFERTLLGTLVIAGTNFFPGSLVILFCSINIYRTARKQHKALFMGTTLGDVQAKKEEIRRSRNALKFVLTVVLAFYISWTPIALMYFYLAGVEDDSVRETFPFAAKFLFWWLTVSNSWMNFFIYSARNKTFREHVKKIFRKSKCLSRNTVSVM